MGSSLEDLSRFPDEVKTVLGYALHVAQLGGKHPRAKPLKGFHGAAVVEVVEDFDGDTYRAIYTVRFAGWVYVLHVFQKKSKKEIQTPKRDLELVKRRLKDAEREYAEGSHTQL